MNEESKSINQSGTAPVVVESNALEVQASQELAKVLQDGRVTQLITYTATLHQLLPVTAIENQSQYDQVIDAFDSSKKLIKLIEQRRIEFVGLPTKVVKMVNDLFNQMKGNAGIAKTHFGALIEAKKQFDGAAHERAQVNGAAATQEPQVVASSEGVGAVAFEDTTPSPSNVVTSAKGAKAHSRSGIEVTVTDPIAFLKVVTSKNKRYKEFSDNVNDLIEIKLGVLKRLIKEGNKRSIPGVNIEKTSTTV